MDLRKPMSVNVSAAEERTGAETETFAFAAVPDAGRVNVANQSYDDVAAHTYTVSVDDRGHATTSCTCPADTYQQGKCKHRDVVEEDREVLAAAAPDVRTAAEGETLGDDVTRALSRSFTLGVDGEGRTHHYYRPADTVVAYSDAGVEHRQRLAGRSLGEWVGFVAQDCSWRERGRLAGLVDVVDDARDGAEGSR